MYMFVFGAHNGKWLLTYDGGDRKEAEETE